MNIMKNMTQNGEEKLHFIQWILSTTRSMKKVMKGLCTIFSHEIKKKRNDMTKLVIFLCTMKSNVRIFYLEKSKKISKKKERSLNEKWKWKLKGQNCWADIEMKRKWQKIRKSSSANSASFLFSEWLPIQTMIIDSIMGLASRENDFLSFDFDRFYKSHSAFWVVHQHSW